jgi:multimeric flavodoxin WrbA
VREGIYEKPCAKEYEHTPFVATVPESVSADAEKQKNVVIVTDCTDTESNLFKMIERFRAILPYHTKIANIAEYPMKAGCLGCFNCAVSGKCVHKDNFDNYLRNEIQTADATVYAFTIKDHSMGARFKQYDDRNFCNGHRTVTVGMPVGYLVSGAYSKEDNLRMIVEGRAETGGNVLCGVATDEYDTDAQIDAMAKTLAFSLESGRTTPKNFYGVGGMKIFRDLIYQMRGMMRADHKFYKKQGIYNDFPQKKKLTSMATYLIGAMLASEKIRKKMGNKMNEGMLAPYKKLFKKLDKENSKQKP